MAHFNTLSTIPNALISLLENLSFTHMTHIQEQSITPILEGRDIMAQSKTGSGKTLAFGIPTLIRTDVAHNKPQTLIIAPTRELADQIAVELRKIAAYKPNLKILTLYGGVPLRPQADSLAKGAHVLIGTPGRIQDHLSKETLHLGSIHTLILDEADRMLDMGFYDDIVAINNAIPHKNQTLLFSATFPAKIEKLGHTLLNHPLVIKVDTQQDIGKIDQIAFETSNKLHTLTALIGAYRPKSLLIFCNTKADVMTLCDKLYDFGHSVIALHGDLDQKERNEAVILFANGSRRILVATDVASRGLDIKEIELVINYDLPFDQEVYTHRIGRTGRADATGIALSIYTPNQNAKCDYITQKASKGEIKNLKVHSAFVMDSLWDTLCLNGGKKDKLRKGDILGAFCKEIGIDMSDIGAIELTETKSYIALHQTVVSKALKALKNTKIKKKKYIAWMLD